MIGTIPVGGLSRTALVQLLNERIGALSETGIDVTYETEKRQGGFILYPVSVTEDTTTALLRIDIDAAADAILAYGHDQNFFFNLIAPIVAQVQRNDGIQVASRNMIFRNWLGDAATGG